MQLGTQARERGGAPLSCLRSELHFLVTPSPSHSLLLVTSSCSFKRLPHPLLHQREFQPREKVVTATMRNNIYVSLLWSVATIQVLQRYATVTAKKQSSTLRFDGTTEDPLSPPLYAKTILQQSHRTEKQSSADGDNLPLKYRFQKRTAEQLQTSKHHHDNDVRQSIHRRLKDSKQQKSAKGQQSIGGSYGETTEQQAQEGMTSSFWKHYEDLLPLIPQTDAEEESSDGDAFSSSGDDGKASGT